MEYSSIRRPQFSGPKVAILIRTVSLSRARGPWDQFFADTAHGLNGP